MFLKNVIITVFSNFWIAEVMSYITDGNCVDKEVNQDIAHLFIIISRNS